MTNTYSFTFGQEELLLLLRILDIPTLPGLPLQPLAGISEEQARIAFATAERSLRARGFLQVRQGEKPFVVYSPVLALIGTCKLAQTLTMIAKQRSDKTIEMRFYYTSPYMVVEHAVPEEGLHRFTGAPTAGDLTDQLKQLLHLNGQQALSHMPEVTFSQQTMVMARNAASIEAAVQALVDQGLPDAVVRPIAQAFVEPVCVGTIGTSRLGEPTQEQNLGLLINHDTIWRLETGKDGATVRATSVSAQQVIEQLQHMMSLPTA